MLIPLRTDAPLYHRPWATIAFIVMNAAIQIWASTTKYEFIDPWVLNYGSVTPVQWVTSAFLHAGWMHCIGNMIFLWVFGLVVEGKIGWKRFIPVYFAITIFSGAFEQIVMMWGEGGSLGASGVIFGLLAMSMLWAPDNEIDLLVFFGWIFTYEMRIKSFAFLFIGMEIFFATMDGFKLSSAMLHLIGAGVGFPIGLIMLKRGWVDCEGWDWISRSRTQRINTTPPKQVFQPPMPNFSQPPAPMTLPQNADMKASTALTSVASTFDNGTIPGEDSFDQEAAFFNKVKLGKLYEAHVIWLKHANPPWAMPLSVHMKMGSWLAEQKHYQEAYKFIDTILDSEPNNGEAALLKAKCLLRENLAHEAQPILDRIEPHLHETKQQILHRQLVMEAETMREASSFELDL